ncbi:hypothetical protein ACFWP7_05290 [Streptomyces sp. NPDC058470]
MAPATGQPWPVLTAGRCTFALDKVVGDAETARMRMPTPAWGRVNLS